MSTGLAAGETTDDSDEFDAPSGAFVPDELVVEDEPSRAGQQHDVDEPIEPLDPADESEPRSIPTRATSTIPPSLGGSLRKIANSRAILLNIQLALPDTASG